jgi:hypothetical protein
VSTIGEEIDNLLTKYLYAEPNQKKRQSIFVKVEGGECIGTQVKIYFYKFFLTRFKFFHYLMIVDNVSVFLVGFTK